MTTPNWPVQSPAEPAAAGTVTRQRWYARRWVQVTAAGVLGLVLGSAAGGSGGSGVTQAQLDAARAETVKAQQDAATAKTQAETALATRQAALDARNAALDAREKKVSGLEAAAKANQFEGDGVYIVGQDVQPGTYKSAGGDTCYWARKTKNGEIIDNHLGAGPTVVVIKASDFSIEARGCQPFRKSG